MFDFVSMIYSFKRLGWFMATVVGVVMSSALASDPAIAQVLSDSDPISSAPSPLTGATAKQREMLETLDMGIIVPGDLPKGFKVVGVTTKPCAPSGCGRGTPEYAIVYRSPSKACFAIEGTSGGVGGPSLDRAVPASNDLLGATEVGFYRNNDLASDWKSMDAESGPYYRLYSSANQNYGCTSQITQKEAVKIVESLVFSY
ncbi:MAG: hypothetical protein RLZZ511_924 [Cyanobacteriota bacterium]|jgi:hypothetical protein